MVTNAELVEALRKCATQRWSDIGGNRWDMPEWIAADRIEALIRSPSERERQLEAALGKARSAIGYLPISSYRTQILDEINAALLAEGKQT